MLLEMLELTLIRNATSLLDFGQGRPVVLVDPMLNDAEAVDAVAGTAPPLRNPRVELPMPAKEIVAAAGAVLVTHLHNDHFDPAARELVPRDMELLCQPSDAEALRDFDGLRPVADATDLGGLTVARVPAIHTLGEHADALGPGSGNVISAPDAPTTYVAGDCVWCPEMAESITRHEPEVIVVNAGAARFLTGSAITMTADDVITVARHAPAARIVAVHLEALNHCPMTRDELRRHLAATDVADRVLVPEDGETLTFG